MKNLSSFVTTVAAVAMAVMPAAPNVAAQSLFDSPELYFGGKKDEYLKWATSDTVAQRYKTSLFLPSTADPTNGVAVHWRITEKHIQDGNLDDKVSASDAANQSAEKASTTSGMSIHLAVAAPATGWVAFGISENGGMHGSDVVAFEAAKPDVLRDLHILDVLPPVDDVCNSWKLVASHVLDGFIIFEAVRDLDTGDPQDRAIIMDQDTDVPAHRIIASWGNGENVEYHGDNRSRGTVRFFGNNENDVIAFEQNMKKYAVGSFELLANNHSILPRETEYANFCLTLNAVITQTGLPESEATNLTIVGFEAVIDKRAEKFVHHFLVFANSKPSNGRSLGCDDKSFNEIVYGWAPGESGLALPPNVGVPFQTGITQIFRIQVHYNNPKMITGAVDNSGVRFHYSKEPREHEMGVFQLGDPHLRLSGQSVGDGITSHSFECKPDCSLKVLKESPVTVMHEYLHMHQTGMRMSNEHFRDGQMIRKSNFVDFFDFEQGRNHRVQQQPFDIRPGDSFRSTCYYDSNHAVPSGEREFGSSSSKEMCIAYLSYYPKKKMNGVHPWMCSYKIRSMPECSAPYTENTLTSDDLQELRAFGPAPAEDMCPTSSPTSLLAKSTSSGSVGSGISKSYVVLLASLLWSVIFLLFCRRCKIGIRESAHYKV